MDLTKRQKSILEAVINEFLENAQAVGSVTVSSKYNIDASPATLRSEMAKLADEGYLFKEHSSSGRIPTTLGIRYFLDEMFEEEELDKIKETELKEKLFRKRFSRIAFIKEAVKVLSHLSNQAALAVIDEMVFYSGVGQLLEYPELEDLGLLQNILNVIESTSLLLSIFDKFSINHNLKVIIGDEIGIDSLIDCSLVYSKFNYFRGQKGYLGVLGPRRMEYRKVIPAVRTISNFIERSIIGWE